VPLEIDTSTPAFGEWRGKFKHEGDGIPIVYIVRADGEVLYAKSGAPQGADLPKLLVQMRKQAGTLLSPKQVKDLTAALEKAKKAHDDGDQATAVRELGKFSQSTSYAGIITEAKELAAKLLEEAKAELEKAQQQLASSDEELLGAIALLRVVRVYTPFKDLVKSAGQLRTKLQKEKKTVLAQAEALDAAAKLEDAKALDRAQKAYQLVAQRYPDTPAAKYAQERLQKLGEPNSETPKSGGAAKKSEGTDR
jgi:hypothetical protein